MGDSYEDFVASKFTGVEFGSAPRRGELSAKLFPHQRWIVDRALTRARYAVFADTGLGKSLMEAEVAHHCSLKGRVLILAPLAVAEQTVREAQKVSVGISYVRRPSDSDSPVVITNYDLLEHFVGEQWAAVLLDESSILKAYDGATRNAIINGFRSVPYRFAFTATPAPNDFTELGNHAEFLGVKSRVEMLAEYFTHDGGDTSVWRLKGHAQDIFWRWVCSWAAAVKRPSDLGYDDGAYNLPPLEMHEHVIAVDHADAKEVGLLFAPDVRTLADQRATRRMTMERRVQLAAELAAGDEPVIIWAELNDEADAVEKAISGCVQIAGSDSPEEKTQRILDFATGKTRALVSKSSICGFGVNLQVCAKVVFLGASHSYEQTYQAIRRCWRFGQTRPVHVHVIRAETEGAIIANYRRKEADAERLSAEMVALMREQVDVGAVATRRETNLYAPALPMRVPRWLTESV